MRKANVFIIAVIFTFCSCLQKEQGSGSSSAVLTDKISSDDAVNRYWNLLNSNWAFQIEQICGINKFYCYFEESPADPIVASALPSKEWIVHKKTVHKDIPKLRTKVTSLISGKSIAEILSEILEIHPAYEWKYDSDKRLLRIVPKPGKEHLIHSKPFSKWKIENYSRKKSEDTPAWELGEGILQDANIVRRRGMLLAGPRRLIDRSHMPPSRQITFTNVPVREVLISLMLLEGKPVTWKFYFDNMEYNDFLLMQGQRR